MPRYVYLNDDYFYRCASSYDVIAATLTRAVWKMKDIPNRQLEVKTIQAREVDMSMYLRKKNEGSTKKVEGKNISK